METKPHPVSEIQTRCAERSLEALTATYNSLRFESRFNDLELKSICSVVAYVSYMQGISERAVCTLLATAFGVDSVKDIPQEKYNSVMHFLIDLQLDEVMN